MPYFVPRPESTAEAAFNTTAGDVVSASFGRTISELPIPSLLTVEQIGVSELFGDKIDYNAAKARAEKAGVNLNNELYHNTTSQALDYRIRMKSEEDRRDAVISLAPDSNLLKATTVLTSFAAQFADPVNVLSGFVPVVGEARAAALISNLGRYGGRAAVGAIEGTVGNALTEAIVYPAQQYIGADYTMNDSLMSIAMGAPFGAVLHAAPEAFRDVRGMFRADKNAAIKPADLADYGINLGESLDVPAVAAGRASDVAEQAWADAADELRSLGIEVKSDAAPPDAAAQLRAAADAIAEPETKANIEAQAAKIEDDALFDRTRQLARGEYRPPEDKSAQYPFINELVKLGGVRVGSTLDAELRAMGVTPQKFRKLFKKDSGLGDIDNLPVEEWKASSAPHDGTGNYVDRGYILNGISEEMAGKPIRPDDWVQKISDEESLLDQLDRASIDIRSMTNDEVRQAMDAAARINENGMDAKIFQTSGETRQAAMNAALAQALDGRPINIEPVMRTDQHYGESPPSPDELADMARPYVDEDGVAIDEAMDARIAMKEEDANLAADEAFDSAQKLIDDDIPFLNLSENALAQLAKQGYEKQDVPRINVAARLRKAIKKLEKENWSEALFINDVERIAADVANISARKSANKSVAERVRGADIVREKLIRARRTGALESDTVDLALWALDKNPNIAENLGISIRQQGDNTGAGAYIPTQKIIRLFEGVDNRETAIHEILHHTERMMPDNVQKGIIKEWGNAYAKALSESTPEQRAFLSRMMDAAQGDKVAYNEVILAFQKGKLDYVKHYPLINPSEFWAVNASRILAARYDAKGWVATAHQWLKEMVEKIKGFLGARSDSSVLKGIDSVFAGDGTFVSNKMLAKGDLFQDLKDRKNQISIDLQSEKRVFDRALKDAEKYPEILRAAVAHIDDANLREKLEDSGVTPSMVTSVMQELRKQHVRVQNELRRQKKLMKTEDAIDNDKSFDEIVAERTAKEIQEKILAAKREAAFNFVARERAKVLIRNYGSFADEGFLATLTGSSMLREGARSHVASYQSAYLKQWATGIESALKKEGVFKQFVGRTVERDIANALEQMDYKNPDMSGLNADAVKIAKILHKYQEGTRLTLNKLGASIKYMQGYITRQSHDPYKINSAGYEAWAKDARQMFDLERMAPTGKGIDTMLANIWKELSSGTFSVEMPTEMKDSDFRSGLNLAKKVSQSRSIIFKKGAWFDYNAKYGTRDVAAAYIRGIENSARVAGLMKMWGSNPEYNVGRAVDDMVEELRDAGDVDGASNLRAKKQKILNNLAVVDGTANIPGNVHGAQIASNIRLGQMLAKLGGALWSSLTDIPLYAANIRYEGRGNMFTGMAEAVKGIAVGANSGSRAEVLKHLDVTFDHFVAEVMHQYTRGAGFSQNMSALARIYTKLNFQQGWTGRLQKAAAYGFSNYLGDAASKNFSALSSDMKRIFKLHGVDEAKWDVMRQAVRDIDGKNYLVTDAINEVPDEVIAKYITSKGRNVTPESIANAREKIANDYRAMVIDRAETAALSGDKRTDAAMIGGTKRGTVWGEAVRFVGQFKSFPAMIIERVLKREIYGRGYDTIGDYMRNGKGDILGLANLLVAMTMTGYISLTIKDAIKGKAPRPLDRGRTWTESMVQGGFFGIAGDYMLNEYDNYSGRSFAASILGPVGSTVNDLFSLKSAIENGDKSATQALKLVQANLPGANLFYVKPVLDYMFMYSLMENMNPGYLRRMEANSVKNTGQEWLIRPSSIAR